MKKNNIPIRRCVACRESFPRDILTKVTKEHNSKKIVLNPNKKTLGRSCYLCKNMECLNSAIKKKSINKSLRAKNIDEKIMEQIKLQELRKT